MRFAGHMWGPSAVRQTWRRLRLSMSGWFNCKICSKVEIHSVRCCCRKVSRDVEVGCMIHYIQMYESMF